MGSRPGQEVGALQGWGSLTAATHRPASGERPTVTEGLPPPRAHLTPLPRPPRDRNAPPSQPCFPQLGLPSPDPLAGLGVHLHTLE